MVKVKLINAFLGFFFIFVVYAIAVEESENLIHLGQLATKSSITEAVFILKNKKNRIEEHRNKIKDLDLLKIDKNIYLQYLGNLELIIGDLEKNILKINQSSALTNNNLRDLVERADIIYEILKSRDKVFYFILDIYKSKNTIKRIDNVLDKKSSRLKKITDNKEALAVKNSINILKNNLILLKNRINKDYHELDIAKEKNLFVEKKYKDKSKNFVGFELNFYNNQFLKKLELVLLK